MSVCACWQSCIVFNFNFQCSESFHILTVWIYHLFFRFSYNLVPCNWFYHICQDFNNIFLISMYLTIYFLFLYISYFLFLITFFFFLFLTIYFLFHIHEWSIIRCVEASKQSMYLFSSVFTAKVCHVRRNRSSLRYFALLPNNVIPK